MKELELLQRPNVDGVFVVIVTQTYSTLNDLPLHHRHLQKTLSCFVAAVLQREGTLGDLKSAITQSDEDVSDRPRVEEGSLIQLNTAVYGLVNASSAWRKTLARH